MVFEYILSHLEAQLDPPYNFVTTVEAVNKLVDLYGHAADLDAHWSGLDADDRVLECDQNRKERSVIEKLKSACVNSLSKIVRINEDERVTELQDRFNALRRQADQKEMELKSTIKEVQEKVEFQETEFKQALVAAQAGENLVEMKNSVPYDEFRVEFSKLCAFPIIDCATRETVNALYKALANFIAFLVRHEMAGYVPDHALISIMHDKLDVSSRVSFAAWLKYTKELTCDAFFDFLKCQLDTIIECEKAASALAKSNTMLVKSFTMPAPTPSPSTSKMVESPSPISKPVGDHGYKVLLKYSRPRCAHCGIKHPLLKCKEFRTSTYEARIRTIRQNRLCENCLLHGHQAQDCDEGPCYRCKVKHNSIMCRDFWDKDHTQQ